MFVPSINGSTNTNCDALFDEHHRLRARIFSQRMEWGVRVEDGLEKDAFDALDPTYILALTNDGRLAGCARLVALLPSKATATSGSQQTVKQASR